MMLLLIPMELVSQVELTLTLNLFSEEKWNHIIRHLEICSGHSHKNCVKKQPVCGVIDDSHLDKFLSHIMF